ncbi:hypothetical protein KR067_000170, partial [Drosophila pandora]
NVTYPMKRIQFDGDDMPQFMPDFNYTFNGKFYGNNILGLEVQASGSFYHVPKKYT